MQIISRPDFKERTTLRIGGQGLLELMLTSENDWENLGPRLEKEGADLLALGAGSNLLIADGVLNRISVRMAPEKQIRVLQVEDAGSALLQVSAGLSLPRLLAWMARYDFAGLQSLTGIPGTVGGAVAMNAGSFGQEISQVLEGVCIWTRQEGAKWLNPGQWRAGYRKFSPKIDNLKWYLILAIQIKVHKAARIKNEMRKVLGLKKKAQPIRSWTCGCLFKNPSAQEPAGLLLERCGLKGFTLGGVGLSNLHANFLINMGQGQSSEAFELIDLAKQRVREKFGHDLELEVRVVK